MPPLKNLKIRQIFPHNAQGNNADNPSFDLIPSFSSDRNTSQFIKRLFLGNKLSKRREKLVR
jgi:hypothetical protein